MWSGKKMANSLETHHIFTVTILSISTLISQLGIIIGGYIKDRRGENVIWENMAKYSKTCHFITVIIIPSKVIEKKIRRQRLNRNFNGLSINIILLIAIFTRLKRNCLYLSFIVDINDNF